MDVNQLHTVIANEGKMLAEYHDQLAAVQCTNAKLLQALQVLPAGQPKPHKMALPGKLDGSTDQRWGFSCQCNIYFAEHATECALVLTLLMGKALDWASAVWYSDDRIRSSYTLHSVSGRCLSIPLEDWMCQRSCCSFARGRNPKPIMIQTFAS